MTPLLTKSKILIAISAILILSNYYYLYFFEFHQGVSSAGSNYNALKFIAIGLLLSQLFLPIVLVTYKKWHVTLLIFCVTASIVIIIKSLLLRVSGGVMLANMLIFAIPLTILKSHHNLNRFYFFFDCCMYVLSMQVIIDYAIYLCGGSLWDNKAFIGGLGNPSSFGVACCIFLAYTLFMKSNKIKHLASATLLAIGALNTNSLMPTLLVAFIAAAALIGRPRLSVFIITSAFIAVLSIFPNSTTDGHTAYKFESLVSAVLDNTDENISESVSLRETIHKQYFEKLTETPATIIFIGDINSPYIGLDSQVLTYLSSFGVLLSLVFLVYTYQFGIASLQLSSYTRLFMVSVVSIYSIAFIFNRILDYYPMALFFFLSARMVVIEKKRQSIE